MKKTRTVSIRLMPVVIAAIIIIALIIGTNSGKVSIWNGQFNVEKLAATLEVGRNNTYTSLQDAVDAASSGDTIQLTESIAISDTVNIRNKNLTIDLNGNTITYTSNETAIVNNGGELKITKGAIMAENAECILKNETGKLTVETLDINNGNTNEEGTGISNGSNSELVFNGMEVEIIAKKPIKGVVTTVSSSLYGIKIVKYDNRKFDIATVINLTTSDYYVTCENIAYKKIQDAIDDIAEESKSEKEIKLARDLKEYDINNSKIIKINLNQKTLTGNSDHITNEGTLTISGGGKIVNKTITNDTSAKLEIDNVEMESSSSAIKNYGTAKIKNSNIIGSSKDECIYNCMKTGEKESVIMDIINTNVEAKSTEARAIGNANGIVTINNSSENVIKSKGSGIYNENNDYNNLCKTELHIKSGTVKAEGMAAIRTKGYVKVSIGDDENDTVSKDNPCIQGENLGLESSSITDHKLSILMYGGTIKGKNTAIEYPEYLTSIPDEYELTDEIEEQGYKVRYLKDGVDPEINSFKIDGYSDSSITVSVLATDNGSGINGYKYYYKTGQATDESYVCTDFTEKSTYTIENLKSNCTYYLYVEVYDKEGNKSQSNSINVTTMNEPSEKGIIITKEPKKIYNYGEDLDLTNGEVGVEYSNGEIRDKVSLTDNKVRVRVDEYDKNKSGDQTIYVYYKNYFTTFTVTVAEKKEDVAQVGDTKYTSLQEAINKAQDNNTITILTNITTTETFEVNYSNVTIDLNGKTIKNTSNDKYVLEVYQNLTIKDSSEGKTGKIIGNNGICVKEGKVTLESGKIQGNGTGENAGIGIALSGKKPDSCGSALIKGGSVWGSKIGIKNTYSQDNGVSNLTVSGGYIEGGEYGIYSGIEDNTTDPNTAPITVNITGGTIKGNGSTGAGVYNGAKSNLTLGTDDGNINTTSPEIIGEADGVNNYYGTMNFYDGKIKGKEASIYYDTENINMPDSYRVYESQQEGYHVAILQKLIPVTGVTLNTNAVSLKTGETKTLTATVAPNNATNKNVTWTSSNPSVATVTNGVIKAVKAGTTTITVKTNDGEKTATCNVTVTNPTVAVTGVTLNTNTVSMKIGQTETLTATVAPNNATNKDVTWTSSNPSVATVTNGVIKAVKAGTTTITVKTNDGEKTATCNVTVTNPTVTVTGVTLNTNAVSLKTGETKTLTATVAPNNATNKNVTWTSSNKDIVTVDGGVVTAVAEGKATITVKTNDGGKTATCSVTVTKTEEPIPNVAVTGVSLSLESLELEIGQTETLTATVAPNNATNKNVTWASSNKDIVTVDGGVVTAVAAGEATITVTTVDGDYTAICTIKVKEQQTSDEDNNDNDNDNENDNNDDNNNEDNDQNNNKNDNASNNNNSNGSNTGSSNSGLSSSDSTQATTSIPQTGVSYAVIGVILIVIVNGIVAYIRYKKSY